MIYTVIYNACCYASTVCAVVISVHLSVTSRHFTKMAKCRITQTMPCDCPGILVLWCHKSRQNSNSVTLYGGAK